VRPSLRGRTTSDRRWSWLPDSRGIVGGSRLQKGLERIVLEPLPFTPPRSLEAAVAVVVAAAAPAAWEPGAAEAAPVVPAVAEAELVAPVVAAVVVGPAAVGEVVAPPASPPHTA